MPIPLTALLLTLAVPQPISLAGFVQAAITPPSRDANGWVAQKQAGALAPSLQGKPVVVDIYADWCSKCQTIAPTLRSLQQKKAGKATFLKFDVSNASALKQSRERARALGLGAFLEANRSEPSLVAVINPATGAAVQTFRASTDDGAYSAAIKKTQAMLKP
ncbi:MAG: thioredoxin family protein [Cyanobium sp. CZS 48M]|nr:thioredoxin family protein [Cyanobium sp. CZS48M]